MDQKTSEQHTRKRFEAIRDALAERGYSWGTAAAAIGKSKSLVIQVANRSRKSRVVAIGLAALVDQDVREVFPDLPEYGEESPADTRERLVAEGRRKVEAAVGRQVV